MLVSTNYNQNVTYFIRNTVKYIILATSVC